MLEQQPSEKSLDHSSFCSNTINSSRSTFAATSAPNSIPICRPSELPTEIGLLFDRPDFYRKLL